MYVVILAGSPREANDYVRVANLPKGRYRYAAQASTIRGLRVAEVHELPGFARRPDRFAIAATLRYAKLDRWVKMGWPLEEALIEAYRLPLEEALAEAYPEPKTEPDESTAASEPSEDPAPAPKPKAKSAKAAPRAVTAPSDFF